MVGETGYFREEVLPPPRLLSDLSLGVDQDCPINVYRAPESFSRGWTKVPRQGVTPNPATLL